MHKLLITLHEGFTSTSETRSEMSGALILKAFSRTLALRQLAHLVGVYVGVDVCGLSD